MRNFLLCLVMLCLSSCIPVDDFRSYWNKGAVDRAMLGTWEKTADAGGDNKPERMLVADKSGTYRIDTLDEEERNKADYAPLPARTLKAGPYHFLMVPNHPVGREGPLSGNIVRYEITGGVLQTYNPNDRRISAFIREKYPAAKNIGDPSCASTCSGSLRIMTFDDEAFEILSAIPTTGEFWAPTENWRKVP